MPGVRAPVLAAFARLSTHSKAADKLATSCIASRAPTVLR